MIEIIDEGGYDKNIVDPFWYYEMARGSGLSHQQAVLEVREYCIAKGLDLDCI